jgi:hypothetical protein
VVAAVSLCNGEAHGILLSPSHSLEIMPLNNRLKRMLDLWKEVRCDLDLFEALLLTYFLPPHSSFTCHDVEICLRFTKLNHYFLYVC